MNAIAQQELIDQLTLNNLRVQLGLTESANGETICAAVAELQTQALRYKFVRALNPNAFTQLWHEALYGETKFDELVDGHIKTIYPQWMER